MADEQVKTSNIDISVFKKAMTDIQYSKKP